MKYFALVLILSFSFTVSHGQGDNPPFSVELQEITKNDWPGLHSFSHAEWEGYWVIMGGRINGLHGFFTLTAFPEAKANDKIWIFDHETGNYWNYSVLDLVDEWKDFLRGTNPQFVQKGKYLYVFGGYGLDNSTEEFVTHDIIMAIDLSVLVPAILAGADPIAAFRVIHDTRFKVCGGEMHSLGEYEYLIGGHDFNGIYKQNGQPTFTQEYTSEIKKFKIVDDGTTFSIQDYSATIDAEFHRRDLSLTSAINRDGEAELLALGGVFKPEADEAYLNPIIISNDEVTVDFSYEQVMSQYTCPVIPLYNSESNEQYYVLFGGISLHFWNEDDQVLEQDIKMPFINDITTMVKYPDGTYKEFVMAESFDQLLGSNAVFFPGETVPILQNEVIDYAQLEGRVLLGYIYGGIEATIPNITPSEASNRLFEVYMDLTTTSSKENAINPDQVLIYSDDVTGKLVIKLSPSFDAQKINIYDITGKLLAEESEKRGELQDAVQNQWLSLSSGSYYVKLISNEREVTKLVFKG